MAEDSKDAVSVGQMELLLAVVRRVRPMAMWTRWDVERFFGLSLSEAGSTRGRPQPVPREQMPGDVWRPDQVAAYLGWSKGSVYRAVQDGTLPASTYQRKGNRLYFDAERLVAWWKRRPEAVR